MASTTLLGRVTPVYGMRPTGSMIWRGDPSMGNEASQDRHVQWVAALDHDVARSIRSSDIVIDFNTIERDAENPRRLFGIML